MLNTLRGNGFDCLLTLISIKIEHPKPLQVCTSVCIIFAHTGAGVIRLNKPCKIEHCIILCIPSRKSSFQREFARIKKWKTLDIDEKKGDSKALMMRI